HFGPTGRLAPPKRFADPAGRNAPVDLVGPADRFAPADLVDAAAPVGHSAALAGRSAAGSVPLRGAAFPAAISVPRSGRRCAAAGPDFPDGAPGPRASSLHRQQLAASALRTPGRWNSGESRTGS